MALAPAPYRVLNHATELPVPRSIGHVTSRQAAYVCDRAERVSILSGKIALK
jgi:hypothetical protein